MLMLPDRPAESETVGVVRRPERVARGAVRDTHGLSGSRAGGSWFAASLAVESVAEAPALGAGVDDVSLVGDPVNDGLREPRVAGILWSTRRTAGSWSRSATPGRCVR